MVQTRRHGKHVKLHVPQAACIHQQPEPPPPQLTAKDIEASYTEGERIGLLITGFRGFDKVKLKSFLHLARADIYQELHPKVTHCVVVVDKNGYTKSTTLKLLNCILDGKKIVSLNWITESVEANSVLDESKYAVKGDINTGEAWPAERGKMFSLDCPVALGSGIEGMTTEDLRCLLHKLGVEIVDVSNCNRNCILIGDGDLPSIEEVDATRHEEEEELADSREEELADSREEEAEEIISKGPAQEPAIPELSARKKTRWTDEENRILKEIFKSQLTGITTTVRNKDLKEALKNLPGRTMSQIRTKLNNIKLGKSTF